MKKRWVWQRHTDIGDALFGLAGLGIATIFLMLIGLAITVAIEQVIAGMMVGALAHVCLTIYRISDSWLVNTAPLIGVGVIWLLMIWLKADWEEWILFVAGGLFGYYLILALRYIL